MLGAFDDRGNLTRSRPLSKAPIWGIGDGAPHGCGVAGIGRMSGAC